jgi:D-2-hydroxyacid dehydrogenase (NADP+)
MHVPAVTVLVIDPAAERYTGRLVALFGERIIALAAADLAAASEHVADAQVVVGIGRELTADFLAGMPRLEWVQCLITGTDHLSPILAGRPEVLLTSARGIHGPQMSEMALLHMLALSRNVRRTARNQVAHVWQRLPQRVLYGKRVAIVGVGPAGEAVGRVCKALGMTVYGVSRTPRQLPFFDRFHGMTDLVEVAGEVDFLVLTIPYNEDTHHLVNAEVLAAMRPTSALVNIARGRVVDEAALIDALREGRIGGAGLDVFEEPELAPNSPLWDMDNVFITSWMAGFSDIYVEQALPVVEENMRRFLDGERAQMRNVVAP